MTKTFSFILILLLFGIGIITFISIRKQEFVSFAIAQPPNGSPGLFSEPVPPQSDYSIKNNNDLYYKDNFVVHLNGTLFVPRARYVGEVHCLLLMSPDFNSDPNLLKISSSCFSVGSSGPGLVPFVDTPSIIVDISEHTVITSIK